MPKLILTLALTLMTVWSTLAQAETPFFNVELLLFQRTNASAGSSEYWSNNTNIPFEPNAVQIQSHNAVGYTLLPQSSFRLTPDRIALEKTGGYQSLLHVKWRQPGLSKKRALPIYLKGNNLEGTVKISLRRFLHANFDMVLNRFSPQSGGYTNFAFKEHRKMRSNELHYVDHPVVGALIRITRVQRMEKKVPEDQAASQEADAKGAIKPN